MKVEELESDFETCNPDYGTISVNKKIYKALLAIAKEALNIHQACMCDPKYDGKCYQNEEMKSALLNLKRL